MAMIVFNEVKIFSTTLKNISQQLYVCMNGIRANNLILFELKITLKFAIQYIVQNKGTSRSYTLYFEFI